MNTLFIVLKYPCEEYTVVIDENLRLNGFPKWSWDSRFLLDIPCFLSFINWELIAQLQRTNSMALAQLTSCW